MAARDDDGKEVVVAEALFQAHSGVRYLVLLAAVLAAAAALAQWRRGGPPHGLERVLAIAFVSLVDLQALLGIVLLTQGRFYGALAGHLVMMVAAVVTAHVGSVLARRRMPTGGSSRVRFLTIMITIALIVGGIAAIGRPIV